MKVVLYLLALIPVAVFAAPVEVEIPEGTLVKRGFGCNGPFDHDAYKCDRHCKDNKFRGGYCNALTGWLRCDCYN